jgi:hypothetical protein
MVCTRVGSKQEQKKAGERNGGRRRVAFEHYLSKVRRRDAERGLSKVQLLAQDRVQEQERGKRIHAPRLAEFSARRLVRL